MKRLLQLLVAVVCAVPAFAQESAFLGKWDITGTGKNADRVYWLEVKKEGGNLVGYFLNRGGSVFKLPSITIENGTDRSSTQRLTPPCVLVGRIRWCLLAGWKANHAGLGGSFGHNRTANTAIAAPMHDSPNRSAAFWNGFNVGWRLAVTMITITLIAARRAWPGIATA